MVKLTRSELIKLRYIARNDAGEVAERPSKTLADFTRRGLVEPGPWRKEASPHGRRIWDVRRFHITPLGRAALAEEKQDG